MNITIKNIKDAYNSNKNEQKIIHFLQNQKSIYNIDTDESITNRMRHLEKTEQFLMSIKDKLNINVNTLIKILNNAMPKNTKVSLHHTLINKQHSYVVVNFSQNGILKQYIIAPVSKTCNNEMYVNLLDCLPSSLNPDCCEIFKDYEKAEEIFFIALAETIKNSRHIYEERLIERMLKLQTKTHNKKILKELNKKIDEAHQENALLQKSPIDDIKVVL